MRNAELMKAIGVLLGWVKFMDPPEERKYHCQKCGFALNVMYMESKNYMVSCRKCEIVSLVKADSRDHALSKIGVKEEQK